MSRFAVLSPDSFSIQLVSDLEKPSSKPEESGKARTVGGRVPIRLQEGPTSARVTGAKSSKLVFNLLKGKEMAVLFFLFPSHTFNIRSPPPTTTSESSGLCLYGACRKV